MTTAFSSPTLNTGDPATLLVDHRSDQAAIQQPDDGQRGEPERENDPQVVERHGQDRAEQELEQVDVQPARARHEHHPECDSRVEHERERLVAGCPAPGPQPLDREAAEHREHERRQDRRDPEQVPGRDTGEGDVPEPVADERGSALDEEEPDRRREHADDRADGEGEPHELEIEHQCACDGSCHTAGSADGGPSKTIRVRTRSNRVTTCSTAPNSWET